MSWKRRRKKESFPRAMAEDDGARARVRANGPRESVGGDGKHATLRRLTRLSEIKCVCEHFYTFTTHSVLVLAFYSTHVSRTSSTIFLRPTNVFQAWFQASSTVDYSNMEYSVNLNH